MDLNTAFLINDSQTDIQPKEEGDLEKKPTKIMQNECVNNYLRDFEKMLNEGLDPSSTIDKNNNNQLSIDVTYANSSAGTDSKLASTISYSQRVFGHDSTNLLVPIESNEENSTMNLSVVTSSPKTIKNKQSRKRKHDENSENKENVPVKIQRRSIRNEEEEVVSKKAAEPIVEKSDINDQNHLQKELNNLESEVTLFLAQQQTNRLQTVNSPLSPINKEAQPENSRHEANNPTEISLVLTCQNDDFYDMNNLNKSRHTNNVDMHSDKLNDFYVNPFNNHYYYNPQNSNYDLSSIEQMLAQNNYIKENHLFEPLSINTNVGINYGHQNQLNTPQQLNYFNNEFTDELGITVRREVNYVDNSNLIIISKNVNQLASNGMFNVVSNDQNMASNDCSVAQKAKEEEEEADDLDETQEINYSQVEGERGRAIKIKSTAVYFKDINLTEIDDFGESTEINYAMKLTRILFTDEELTNGIFALPNGKSRSLTRETLDVTRTDILKNAIKAKFGQEDEDYDIEAQWVKTRNLLNKKIPKIRPIVNGSSVISQLKVKKEPDTLKVKLNIKKKNKSD